MTKHGFGETQIGQCRQRVRVCDELRQNGVLKGHLPIDQHHAAGRAVLLEMLLLLLGKDLVARFQQPRDQRWLYNASDHAVTVFREKLALELDH